MVYCELCGAANDIMNQQCHRCGHHFVPVEAGSAEVVQPVLAQTGAQLVSGAQEPESAASIGAGLELPEWLQRAAASTPEIPAAQRMSGIGTAPPQFPPFESIAVQPPESMVPPAVQRPQVAQSRPDIHHPAETAQTGTAYSGGSSTMPEWLKTGKPPVVQPAQPEATDTSSFIGEGDLPEWIRQIGAADTAKREEEERIAAALARATEEPAPTKTQLPGESAANGQASNPWLSRKEQAGVATAWSSGTAAPLKPATIGEPGIDDDDRPEVVQVDPALIPPAAKSKSKRSLPPVKMPSVSRPTMPKFSVNLPSTDSSSPMLRYILIGAIALLVLLLLVLVVL